MKAAFPPQNGQNHVLNPYKSHASNIYYLFIIEDYGDSRNSLNLHLSESFWSKLLEPLDSPNNFLLSRFFLVMSFSVCEM